MRDPDRIPEVLGALRRAWLANPDYRLGQLILNLASEKDPWRMEDGDWLQRLNALAALPSSGGQQTGEEPGEVERLRALVEDIGGLVMVGCDAGHVVGVDDGEGTVYACPLCALAEARAQVAAVEALCAEGPGSPLDPTHGYVSLRRIRAALAAEHHPVVGE